MRSQGRRRPLWAVLLLANVCAAGPREELVDFDISEQPARAAIQEFRSQSGVQVYVREGVTLDFTAQAVRGRYTRESAMARLLFTSPLKWEMSRRGDFTLHLKTPRPDPGSHAAAATNSSLVPAAMPQVAISGSRTLNTDQPRTENQPVSYNIFGMTDLWRSGEADARAFLATEFPAYSPRGVALGAAAITGASGQITVRGLPSSETVILFNGHRRAGSYAGGELHQPDLAMAPLPLLERIEVRTASASALFGSDAVVGSINLVRKLEEARTRFFVRAEDLSGVSSGTQQFAGEKVIEFQDGRSWLVLDAAYLRQGGITLGRRNFITGGWERMARNNPQVFADAPLPPLGLLRNVRAVAPGGFQNAEGARYLYLPSGFRAGDDLSTLAPNANRYSLALAPSAQAMGQRSSLRPERRIYSVGAATRWEFSDLFSADLDSGFAESLREGQVSALDVLGQAFFVPATQVGNPIPENLLVAIGTDIADRRMARRDRAAYTTLGAELHPTKASVIRLDHAWSSTRATIRQSILAGDTPDLLPQLIPLLLNEPAGPEALANAGLWLTDASSPQYRNAVDETTLRYSNSAAAFPTGVGSFTVSAQRLVERIAVGPGGEFLPGTVEPEASEANPAARRAKRTWSLLASANVPIGGAVGYEDVGRLLAELLVRRDAVTIEAAPDAIEAPTLRFRSVSYTTALKWQALDELALRVQYSTGFLPPPLPSLSGMSSTQITSQPLFDPLRGGESLNGVRVRSGGNYALKPERSRTYGVGFVWTSADEKSRLSMDYTRLVKTDVVLTPSDLFFADSEGYLREYTERVHRAEPEPGSPWAVGKIRAIDTWSINIARQQVEAVDINFAREGQWLEGKLALSALGSFQPVSTHRAADFLPQENDAGVGNLASPIWRGIASLTWERGSYTLGVTTRYTSSYVVSRSESIRIGQGARKVGSQNYVDAFVAYELPSRWTTGAETQLRLDGTNVLRRDPPADLGERGYASRVGLEEFPGVSLSLNVRF